RCDRRHADRRAPARSHDYAAPEFSRVVVRTRPAARAHRRANQRADLTAYLPPFKRNAAVLTAPILLNWTLSVTVLTSEPLPSSWAKYPDKVNRTPMAKCR